MTSLVSIVGGIVVAVLFVVFLAKFLVKKATAVQTVLKVLEQIEGLIMMFMPEKYKEVYQAVIAAVKKVTDGNFTQTEAIDVAKSTFNQTLKVLGVTLTETEKEFAEKILVFIVGVIVTDKAAASVAVAEICAVNNFSF